MEIVKCSICKDFFDEKKCLPLNLQCGHVLCKNCLMTSICPIDGVLNSQNPNDIPINIALLVLLGIYDHFPLKDIDLFLAQASNSKDRSIDDCFLLIQIISKCFSHFLANIDDSSKLKNSSFTFLTDLNKSSNKKAVFISRSLQKKIFTLVINPITTEECRLKLVRSAKSLIERICHDIIHSIQVLYGSSVTTSNLWNAVRSRGCQFLGPKIQNTVLKQIISTLGDGSALARKTLVLYIVRQIEKEFPNASKTSVGHVVQLLYRASCFKVTKREDDSSLMQLQEKYYSFEELRRAHDVQMVQIASEVGLRISPDHWSYILYGDDQHKSYMQSIIDKVQPPYLLFQSIQELYNSLGKICDPLNMRVNLTPHFSNVQKIDIEELKKKDSLRNNVIYDILYSTTCICNIYSQFLSAIEQNHLPTEEFKSSREKIKSKKVCYFHSNFGICMKSLSCPFSHDLSNKKSHNKPVGLPNFVQSNDSARSPKSDFLDNYQHLDASSQFEQFINNNNNVWVNDKRTFLLPASHSYKDAGDCKMLNNEESNVNFTKEYSIRMKSNVRNTYKNLGLSLPNNVSNIHTLTPSASSYFSSNENSFKDFENQNLNTFETSIQHNSSYSSFNNLSSSFSNLVPQKNSYSSSFDRTLFNDSQKSIQHIKYQSNSTGVNFNDSLTFSGNLIANQLKLHTSREEFVSSLEKNSTLDNFSHDMRAVLNENHNSGNKENPIMERSNSYLEHYLGVDINTMFDEML